MAESPSSPKTQRSSDADTMPIVALGASAGGLQALEAFFDALPTDTGMAFVVLMHLSPDHESNLSKILRHHTTLTVQRIEDGMALEANGVYVLPPKTELGTEGGQLQLKEVPALRDQRTVIDGFLRALAADQGEEAIGIILSGTGTDGTQGMKAIKEAGGFTMVQAPDEAEHDGMPRSAIETGLIDVVAPVGELAAQLTQYWTHATHLPGAKEVEELPEEDEHVVHKILAQVYAGTGHDFSNYKRSTVMRRIARRLTVNQRKSLSDYLELLRGDPDEVEALFRELLISVTSFFRDPEAFAALEERVIPKLFEEKDFNDQVRVWSVGCATGEEAYSLAMLLHEQAERMDRPPEIQVFATDISEEAIETARQGLYPESIAADMTPERVKRYLMPEGTHYRVRQELHEMVLFADHNLLEDPPFSKLDLVSCRNLLIYLNREMQEHVFKLIHYALRPGGYLFLGASESIGAVNGLFSDVDKQHSIYQRRPRSHKRRDVPLFPLKKRLAGGVDLDQWKGSQDEKPESVEELHQRLLTEEVASIIVDDSYNIVHLTGRAARYLEYSGGAPTHNVLEVAPKQLRLELRGGLYQAFQKNRATKHRWVQMEVQEAPKQLSVRIRPVEDGKSFAQIIITEAEPTETEVGVREGGDKSKEHEHEAQLEEELRKTKEQLQATIEEYETTTEEMEASNEELLSMNEELQSKNEEIETSKEELQSVNEELKTTNQELKTKIEELRRSNSDLKNLMEATHIATLFLDRQLTIQRFTPQVRELFNIRATDTGRPLSDFSQKFEYDQLIEDAQTVLDQLQPIEAEFQTDEGRWFLARLRPYRTVDNRIDGVVITFIDVTDLKRAERELRESEKRYRTLFESIDEGFCIIEVIFDERGDPVDYRFLETNPAFNEQAGLSDAVGKRMRELEPNHEKHWFETYGRIAQTGEPERFTNRAKHLDDRWFDVYAFRVGEPEDRKVAILFTDITKRKEAMQRLQEERNFIDRVLETVGALITVVDMEGRIIRFNRECEVVSGYSAEEAEGENVFELLIPPDDHEGVRQVMEEHREGSDQTIHENHWITKDGERRLIRWSSTALRDEEGRIQNVIGTGIDITERRQLERQVVNVSDEERRRIGQDLHDMLSSQLAGVAMMVRSLAGQAEKGEPVTADELRKVADLVNESGDQARALSHSLMPLEVQGEELADGLRHLAERQETMRPHIACSFEASDSIPSLGGEVASHLYRIASEAVGNAVKHADPDSIAIRLAVEDGRLILTVRDDGVGIPEDTEPTDGLGLHMMRYRSELIGASLDIKPAEEDGTLVRCYLPLQRTTQHAEQQRG